MTDVVVVGGGVIGAALTYRLARDGAKVTVVDADLPGNGTSAASFAWTNSNNKQPLEYHQLNTGGMAEHEILRDELGYAPWFHQSGNLEMTPPEKRASQREKVERLHAWGYHAEWLTRADVAAIEPNLVLPDDIDEVVFYPAEGYIDPPLFVGGLLQAAERHGAKVRTHTRVTEVIQESGRAQGVITADGSRIEADAVVFCTGRWSDEMAEIANVQVPMAPNVGMIVLTDPAPVVVKAVVHTPSLTMRTDGAGRMMIRSADHDKKVQLDTPTVPVPPECYEILDRAVALLPKLHGVKLEAARITLRSIPGDGHPLVGPIPGWNGLYIVATHSGVTMAPLLARMLTREILTGKVDPRLAMFRPDRLINASAPS